MQHYQPCKDQDPGHGSLIIKAYRSQQGLDNVKAKIQDKEVLDTQADCVYTAVYYTINLQVIG